MTARETEKYKVQSTEVLQPHSPHHSIWTRTDQHCHASVHIFTHVMLCTNPAVHIYMAQFYAELYLVWFRIIPQSMDLHRSEQLHILIHLQMQVDIDWYTCVKIQTYDPWT